MVRKRNVLYLSWLFTCQDHTLLVKTAWLLKAIGFLKSDLIFPRVDWQWMKRVRPNEFSRERGGIDVA